ncbi:DUF3135 domain-containing protein [Uliginosibacterium sp. 31-16]|uniref:DUF3135 domain-containing protein n=1 Tax=Uliginosibacterium sp. 31-16 TaxID=3068315 RepID=UPI00273E7733|nr:DUF3135 domain-containing protein [Uliginosibacterium sp. 31-16]MDP5240297.1 DUF3135 domain-containing protein [Uliginosibacterium sp. 31-16]
MHRIETERLYFSYTRLAVAPFEFDFDFEHWRGLAEADPRAFFAAREEVLARFMAAAPKRLSGELHALQALIDHSRAEAGSPVNSSRLLLGMMAEHLAALSGHMTQLHRQSTILTARLPPVVGE